MRLMQPAVEQCLNRAVYVKDTDTTRLLREIDSAAEKAVTAVSGDAAISRVLLLTVTGLVQAVRCRRLSLFEAEEDLKKACSLLPTGAGNPRNWSRPTRALNRAIFGDLSHFNTVDETFHQHLIRVMPGATGSRFVYHCRTGAARSQHLRELHRRPATLGPLPTFPPDHLEHPECLSFHEPYAHGEPQETTTCPLKRSFPPTPIPPRSR